MKKIIFCFIILLILLSSIAFAQELILPEGLKKAIEDNKQSSEDFLVKISFFIAFVAGILGILSPCIFPLLPAYFSYTFKEKKEITKMTLVFFVGFSLTFVIMGAIVGFIGEQSLSVIQGDWLVTIAGLFIVLLGIMALIGKGFASFIKIKYKSKNDIPGTFLLGFIFAIGWTACLGPILAGILGIGALLQNVLYSAVLLFFYSLGNLVPLFIFSLLYDKFNLSQSKLIRGKLFKFSISGKTIYLHSTNLLSGILMIIIGLFIIINKGTGVVNRYDIFKTRSYFYLFQNRLLEWQYANILGAILFFSFVIILGIFFWKQKKGK